MKRIENRLRRLERVQPGDDFVRLPEDLSLWTQEHIEGLARWYKSAGEAGPVRSRNGCVVLRPSPLDHLSPYTLKALHDVLVELLDTGLATI